MVLAESARRCRGFNKLMESDPIYVPLFYLRADPIMLPNSLMPYANGRHIYVRSYSKSFTTLEPAGSICIRVSSFDLTASLFL